MISPHSYWFPEKISLLFLAFLIFWFGASKLIAKLYEAEEK